jgi:hypothetical protein
MEYHVKWQLLTQASFIYVYVYLYVYVIMQALSVRTVKRTCWNARANSFTESQRVTAHHIVPQIYIYMLT